MAWRNRLKSLVRGLDEKPLNSEVSGLEFQQQTDQQVCLSPATPDISLRIDLTQQRQVFEGFGTSLCWWAHVVGNFADPLRQKLVDLVFDPECGLGMQVSGRAPFGLRFAQQL